LDFVYDHDFDENGVFFYLGTAGLKYAWQNPHTLRQVNCSASSLGSGKIEDFVGRSLVNCRTLNEPFSFFSVDLGQGRTLAPTCYSLRNRNSTTHVLVNWHFEASNDHINWVLLDRRIYLSEDPSYNQSVAQEQDQLCQKGATSTWGIDTQVYSNHPANAGGFRFFRIVQVGKNSSGSDNLTLSGLEIYGRVLQMTSAWDV
jgi:hypothetical protein